jgi:hypothetical protein
VHYEHAASPISDPIYTPVNYDQIIPEQPSNIGQFEPVPLLIQPAVKEPVASSPSMVAVPQLVADQAPATEQSTIVVQIPRPAKRTRKFVIKKKRKIRKKVLKVSPRSKFTVVKRLKRTATKKTIKPITKKTIKPLTKKIIKPLTKKIIKPLIKNKKKVLLEKRNNAPLKTISKPGNTSIKKPTQRQKIA